MAGKQPAQVWYEHVGWLEFNVPFQRKYGYIRDDMYEEMTSLSPSVYSLDHRLYSTPSLQCLGRLSGTAK